MGVKDPGYDEPLPPQPQTDANWGCCFLILVFLLVSAAVALVQVLF